MPGPRGQVNAMPVPKRSDICVSIRHLDPAGRGVRTLEKALALVDAVRPDRLEWSYITDDEPVRALKARCPMFVAALNTIYPPGHAVNLEGDPIIAPWMRRFGSPQKRFPYICMNNPEDLTTRVEQITDCVARGIATDFQFDDWLGNAQMIGFQSACFCAFCQTEFARYLGLDLNYRDYLHRRGIATNAQLVEQVKAQAVPLWDDYRRFAEQAVRRYLTRIRAAIARATGHEPVLSVNGLANDPRIAIVRGLVSYLNGEIWKFSPGNLMELGNQARAAGLVQISSFFPDVPAEQYHTEAFVQRVRRSIAVAYAVGVVPLFPYDVFAGDQPRWFGTWEEYRAPYDFVRAHRDVFDFYAPVSLEEQPDGAVVVTVRHLTTAQSLRHHITADGSWRIE
jgi:hypothetical protein